MRIRRIRVESFGTIRDRTFDVSPGMTVFHGPNESGKTTLMEFIRSATVPSPKRNQYPARRKSDSGTIEYEEGGESRTLRLDHRSVSGDIPSLPTGADDPALYRSVFAMDRSGLEEDVVSGDIRNRFLTVPGGDRMPSARKAIEDRLSESIGKTARSQSRVNSISAEIASNADSVAEARAEVDSYSGLASRRDALAEELDAIRRSAESLEADRRLRDLYGSQAANYARLGELSEELRSLGDFREVTGVDAETHASLVADEDRSAAECRVLEAQREALAEGLMGADARAVSRASQRIDSLHGRLESYRRDCRRASAPAPEPVTRRVERTVRRTNPLVYAGAVIAVAGVCGLLLSTYCLVAAVAGAALAAYGLLRPSVTVVTDTVVDPAPADDGRAAAESSARGYESEVSELMAELGLRSRGTEQDVDALVSVRAAAVSVSSTETQVMRLRLRHKDAQIALSRFESAYGGRDGYDDCVARTKRARDIGASIAALRDSISAAGLDPDTPECPVPETDDSHSDRMQEVSRSIGETEQMMRAILDTEEVERLMDRREELCSLMADALRDGAVAILAMSLAEDACEDIYSSVQPGVVSTANRYLAMMTGGRYSIDTNPMEDGLSVRSPEGTRGIGQWSSGLHAQVMLSVKLAVARELGAGGVPVILDDVLLPFDSERKEGACRALAELSSEMQVLMFTCDRETAEICRGLEGVSMVDMGS